MSTLGKDAKLYRNQGSQATPDWQEVPCVRDLTLNRDSATADATCRASGGFRRTRASLREMSLDFQMVYQAGDSDGHDLFIADYFADPRVSAEYLVLTGDKDAGAGLVEGVQGTFELQNYTENQNIEDIILMDVTLVLPDGFPTPTHVVSPIT